MFRLTDAWPDRVRGFRLWISPDGESVLDPIEASPDLVFALAGVLGAGEVRDPDAWEVLGRELLPEPLADRLRSGEPGPPLVVVPHGPLWHVPFPALRAGGHTLIETRQVVLCTGLGCTRCSPSRSGSAGIHSGTDDVRA